MRCRKWYLEWGLDVAELEWGMVVREQGLEGRNLYGRAQRGVTRKGGALPGLRPQMHC